MPRRDNDSAGDTPENPNNNHVNIGGAQFPSPDAIARGMDSVIEDSKQQIELAMGRHRQEFDAERIAELGREFDRLVTKVREAAGDITTLSEVRNIAASTLEGYEKPVGKTLDRIATLADILEREIPEDVEKLFPPDERKGALTKFGEAAKIVFPFGAAVVAVGAAVGNDVIALNSAPEIVRNAFEFLPRPSEGLAEILTTSALVGINSIAVGRAIMDRLFGGKGRE